MQLIILSRTREKMTYFAVRRNFFSKKMFRIAPLDGTKDKSEGLRSTYSMCMHLPEELNLPWQIFGNFVMPGLQTSKHF